MTLQTPDAVIEELRRLIGSRWAEGTQDMETTVILDALPALLADHAAMRAEIERLESVLANVCASSDGRRAMRVAMEQIPLPVPEAKP